MKTTKFFFMAALALMTAACSSNDDELIQQPVEQPANNMITITAKLAPKSSSAQTRAMNESGGNIVVDWAQNEQLQIISANGYTATANIDAVDGSGTATISFTIDAAAVGQNCTIVYPASAAATTGALDYASNPALTSQDGTLNANLDVRVGNGTINADNPGTLTVTTQPAAQYSIFKFTTQDLSSTDKTATQFKVSDNSGNVITTVTPTSSAFYVALPVMAAAGTYWFNATIDSKPYIAKATVGTATTAGNYYQSTVKMATIGDVILSDGKFAARSSTGTKVAMIAYLGSDNGENSPYNHGLALALSDANSGSTCKWKTSSDDAGHTKQSSSTFTEESGLQYNDATHNSDTYPAFKAAIANNSTAAPTGCSAWFLASGYQWNKMITAAGGYAALLDGFSGITGASNLKSNGLYWSSTEYNSSKAWYLRFSNGSWFSGQKHTTPCYVRACLAF